MQKKTYKLPVVLDCWYLTGDKQVRIYLRPAQEPKRKWRPSLRTRLRIRKIVRLLTRLSITAAIVAPSSLLVIEAVYRDRGYRAVGGECLLSILLAVVVFKGTGDFF